MKRAGGKIEGACGVEMRGPGEDHPCHRSRNQRPEQLGELSNGPDGAIQQPDSRDAAEDGNHRARSRRQRDVYLPEQRQRKRHLPRHPNLRQRRPQKRGVLRQSHASGGDGERRAEGKLPDVEKRQHAPEALASIDFAQVTIRATGAGHSGSQFRPHQAIAQSERGTQNPSRALPADRPSRRG